MTVANEHIVELLGDVGVIFQVFSYYLRRNKAEAVLLSLSSEYSFHCILSTFEKKL